MEKPEENAEKKEETTETTKKSVKIDGISSQINLGQGTPAHQQWARIMLTSGHSSPSACLKMVMDAYENPKVDTDNSEVISNLEKQVGELTETNKAKDQKISELEKQLEAANKTANENATAGLGKQLQLDELKKQLEGTIVIRPTMAEAYFIEQMAKKCGVPPERMLRRLFWDDLFDPRSNNFKDRQGHEVSTPTAMEIRSVVNQLKERLKQPQNQ